MAKIQILDKEFELDMFDAEDCGRVEEAMAQYDKAYEVIEAKASQLSNKEYIIEHCRAVFECFNAIFGEGSDRKIFGDKCNIAVCCEAIIQLKQATEEKQTEALNERLSKYMPKRQLNVAK